MYNDTVRGTKWAGYAILRGMKPIMCRVLSGPSLTIQNNLHSPASQDKQNKQTNKNKKGVGEGEALTSHSPRAVATLQTTLSILSIPGLSDHLNYVLVIMKCCIRLHGIAW